MVRAFPNYPVLADYKTMDSGGKNVHRTKGQGGHIMTVCANAPDETVKAAVAASKETGVMVIVDTIGVKQQAARARQCEEWGVHMIYLHYGADQRAADSSQDSTQWLDEVLEAVSIPVGVGCFGVEDAVRAVQRGAEMVAIGHPVISGANPLEELREFVREVRANYRPQDATRAVADVARSRRRDITATEVRCGFSYFDDRRFHGQISLLFQHEHDPRPEVAARRRDRHRRQGRLPGHRAMDQRDRSARRAGGSLADLKKRISDQRADGRKRDRLCRMDRRRRCAPHEGPGAGAARHGPRAANRRQADRGARRPARPTSTNIDYMKVAERYRALLVVGRPYRRRAAGRGVGVLEDASAAWGRRRMVAIESGHPKACVLPDVYHLYKGGSDFAGLKLLNGAAMHVFHMNDYPAEPPAMQ